MIILAAEDILALHYTFQAGGPVEGKEIQAMTGLDIRQLIEGGIIRRIGRYDTSYHKGPNFPNRAEIHTSRSEVEEELTAEDLKERRADELAEWRFETNRGEGKI